MSSGKRAMEGVKFIIPNCISCFELNKIVDSNYVEE